MDAKLIRNIIVGLTCAVTAFSAGAAYIKPKVTSKPEDFIVFYDIPTQAAIEAVGTKVSALVSINEASLEELMTLPSIGEVKAKAIITYREEYGAFVSIDELTEVKGIGEATLEKLREKICL